MGRLAHDTAVTMKQAGNLLS